MQAPLISHGFLGVEYKDTMCFVQSKAFVILDLYYFVMTSPDWACFITFNNLQPATGHVRMEGHAMNQPVHVTVQRATVGTPVKVSALHA